MTSTDYSEAIPKRLKYLVELRRNRDAAVEGNGPYIGLENIESGTGHLLRNTVDAHPTSTSTIAGVEAQWSVFEPGDVLFGKLRPYLAKAWVAEFSGRCTSEALVMRPVEVEPRFLLYICLSRAFVDAVDASTYGSKMPRAEWDFIGSVRVRIPRRSQQLVITNYLDRETVRLDALIGTKERLLELLMEKRTAIIATAVTRGLSRKSRMRDSGVSWLGEIPAHWEIERARWLFRERDVRSVTGGEELLTVSHITGVTPRSEKDVNMFEAATNEGYKICLAGDLVINTLWAWMGAMGIAPVNGIVSPAYNVYEPGPRLEPAYVDALVRLPVFAQEVTRYSKGVWSSRLRLYPEGFFETSLPVPPLSEQRTIVNHIANEVGKLDSVRSSAEKTIDLLKERRAAIIEAAVTGQINLENAT